MGINEIFFNYLTASIFVGFIIILNLALSRFFTKRYSARMKYFIWLILALYLLVPIRLQSRQQSLNLIITDNQEVSFYNDLTKKEYKVTNPKPEVEKKNSSGSTNLKDNKQNHWNLTRIIVYLWLIGIGIAALSETAKYFYTLRVIRTWSVKPKNEEIQSLCDRIKYEMGVKKSIGIFISKRINSPMLCGFIKPGIYLPKDEWNFKELEYILKHEFTHYKRRDLWYKLLIRMAVIIHWYNPFVHLMQRYASMNIECCCDDAMLKGQSYEYRRAYSEVILNNMEAQNVNYLTTAFSGGSNEMKQRFENILSMKKRKKGIIPVLSLILVLFVMGSFVGCSFKESVQKATSSKVHQINAGQNLSVGNLEETEGNDSSGSDESMQSSETKEDYYMIATSLTAKEVEQFAAEIKNDVINQDWDSFAEKIAYPIEVSGITVNNREDFLKLDLDGKLNEKFAEAIREETCQKMFCNSQGVMMGATGQIWFGSVDDGKGNLKLQIIGINDMLEEK